MSDFQNNDHLLLQFGFFDSPASEFEEHSFRIKDVVCCMHEKIILNTASGMSGAINLFGTLVPVFDCRERLALKNTLQDNLMLCLLENERDLLTCFMDSKIPGIVNSVFHGVLWDLVDTARLDAGHIKCIVKLNGRVLVFLSLNKLLSSDGCLIYPAGVA